MSDLTLKQLLVAELPPGFVRAILAKFENIYHDTYEAISKDSALGDKQAAYVLGYYRRGVVETAFMNLSSEHGLQVDEIQPSNGGCKHIRISTEHFYFVICHVQSSGGFPRHSDNREQSSSINRYLSQIDFFPYDFHVDGKEFYGIFVHTEQLGNKDIFDSLYVGFPDIRFESWVEEPVDLQEIRDLQQRQFQAQDDLQAQVQNAVPTWKKQKKQASDEE